MQKLNTKQDNPTFSVFSVLVPCVFGICCVLIVAWPNLFTVASGDYHRPNIFFYLILGLITFSGVNVGNGLISMCGFRSKSIVAILFTILFVLGIAIAIILRFFWSSLIDMMVRSESNWAVLVFYFLLLFMFIFLGINMLALTWDLFKEIKRHS